MPTATPEPIDPDLPGWLEPVPRTLPDCGGVRLHLLADDYPRGPLPGAGPQVSIAAPPYWAFCWASGLALARHRLRHPEWVAGRSVLDFGCGSAVVGIAAARAGAARVIVCDQDSRARAAALRNAALNGVEVEATHAVPFERNPLPFELMLASDVCYEEDNLTLLQHAASLGIAVLAADSRLDGRLPTGFQRLGTVHARTIPDLDEAEHFNRITLFSSCSPS